MNTPHPNIIESTILAKHTTTVTPGYWTHGIGKYLVPLERHPVQEVQPFDGVQEEHGTEADTDDHQRGARSEFPTEEIDQPEN